MIRRYKIIGYHGSFNEMSDFLGEEKPAWSVLADPHPENKVLKHSGHSISPTWKIEMMVTRPGTPSFKFITTLHQL